jgi:hypothetical protein
LLKRLFILNRTTPPGCSTKSIPGGGQSPVGGHPLCGHPHRRGCSTKSIPGGVDSTLSKATCFSDEFLNIWRIDSFFLEEKSKTKKA